MAASARISCPLATSYLAVSVQDLMAADTSAGHRRPKDRDELAFLCSDRAFKRPVKSPGPQRCDTPGG